MAKEKADKANAEADQAKASDSDAEDESNAATSSEAVSSDASDENDSDDDDSDSDADADEVTKADGPEAKKSSSTHPPQLSDHDQDGHGDQDHGLAHVMPVKALIGVWAALMVLTVLTVSVTSFDMGYRINLVVAMVIATIKAALVMLFFMHLWWDKRFNVVVFAGAFLFVALFIGLTLNDRGEYQHDINAYENAKAQK